MKEKSKKYIGSGLILFWLILASPAIMVILWVKEMKMFIKSLF
jgi:hypothetical protein